MKKSFRGLPRILKINEVDSKNLRISVLFNNGENRVLDFNNILKNEWKVESNDPEFKLLEAKEFKKVHLENNTLTWDNIALYITDKDNKKVKTAFDVGADVLYELSIADEKRSHSIGELFRKWRIEAKMTQDEVAEKAGTSRTYITKLENGKQDVGLDTLYRIVEAGLGKNLKLSVE